MGTVSMDRTVLWTQRGVTHPPLGGSLLPPSTLPTLNLCVQSCVRLVIVLVSSEITENCSNYSKLFIFRSFSSVFSHQTSKFLFSTMHVSSHVETHWSLCYLHSVLKIFTGSFARESKCFCIASTHCTVLLRHLLQPIVVFVCQWLNYSLPV